MEQLIEPLIALVALTVMEIVLGIDNIVFIAILTSRLPQNQQPSARRLGLGAALVTRILLLLTLTVIMQLEEPIFSLSDLGFSAAWFSAEVNHVSWRDLILIAGGLFLIAKSVHEIHNNFEEDSEVVKSPKIVSFAGVLVQIAVLDIVFSLDSVITAVGMAKDLWVMVTAVIIAVGVMLVFSEAISGFIERHPTIKMLAISFLLLIGVMLVAEGIGTHVEKGYIYFAMAFSLIVEFLNMKSRHKKTVVEEA